MHAKHIFMIHMGTSDSIVSLICFSLDANAFPVHILNLIDIIKFNVFIFPLLTTTLFVFLLHFFFFSFRPPCARTHTLHNQENRKEIASMPFSRCHWGHSRRMHRQQQHEAISEWRRPFGCCVCELNPFSCWLKRWKWKKRNIYCGRQHLRQNRRRERRRRRENNHRNRTIAQDGTYVSWLLLLFGETILMWLKILNKFNQ